VCGTCEGGDDYCILGKCGECPDPEIGQPWDGCDDGKIVEFQINEVAAGEQIKPKVAIGSEDRFLVIWEQDVKIYGRLFDSDANPLTGDFYIDEGDDPTLGPLADGRFIAGWHGKYARIIDENGEFDGEVLNLVPAGVNKSMYLAVEGTPDGNLVAVFQYSAWDGYSSKNHTKARFYDYSGAMVGTEHSLIGNGDQSWNADIAVALDSTVLVGFHRLKSLGSDHQVYGRLMNSTQLLSGVNFHEGSEGKQAVPRVTRRTDGRWVGVWASDPTGYSGYDVHSRRIEADGAQTTTQFIANSTKDGNQSSPDVTWLNDGEALAVWNGGGPLDDGGVVARELSAEFGTAGDEVQVNSYTDGSQVRPDAKTFPDGSTIVVWQSAGQDGSSTGIFALRFDTDLNKRFR